MKKMVNRRGQVWVETVIYTLIAFIMIGAVLAYAKPKIEQLQDKALIEKSTGVLKTIDATMLSIVQSGVGNIRRLPLGLGKGEIKIDGEADKIIFEIQTAYQHSQLDTPVENGNIVEKTTKYGGDYLVTLTLDYSGKRDITAAGRNEVKTISKSSTEYTLIIENKGKSGDLTVIDLDLG